MDGGRTLSRRDLMRRSAVVGGVVWAAPAITTLGKAMAAGSVVPKAKHSQCNHTVHRGVSCTLTDECQACWDTNPNYWECCTTCVPGTVQTYPC